MDWTDRIGSDWSDLRHDGRCNDLMKSHFYLQAGGMPFQLQEYPRLLLLRDSVVGLLRPFFVS